MEKFDVIVLGATGYTGLRVCEYLQHRARETGQTWAVAGRDQKALDGLVATYGADGTIAADCNEEDDCDRIAGAGKVVANLAGPYYGRAEKIVAACAATGVHYLDLTGELVFVRGLVDNYHDMAQASGARITPVAGYEALPFDLMTLALLESYMGKYGESPTHIDLLGSSMGAPEGSGGLSDMISGGTAETMRVMLEKDFSGLASDPTALNAADDPDRAAIRKAMPYHLTPMKDDLEARSAPIFPGPFLHPAIVNRTFAMLRQDQRAIGTNIRYRERMSMGDTGKGIRGAIIVYMMAYVAKLMNWLTSTSMKFPRRLARKMFDRVAPVPGEGPPVDKLDDWQWGLSGKARGAAGEVSMSLDAAGHPGYRTTANMMAEAALILADDDAAKPDRAGVLTPASALGVAELDRFARAGMRFSTPA